MQKKVRKSIFFNNIHNKTRMAALRTPMDTPIQDTPNITEDSHEAIQQGQTNSAYAFTSLLEAASSSQLFPNHRRMELFSAALSLIKSLPTNFHISHNDYILGMQYMQTMQFVNQCCDARSIQDMYYDNSYPNLRISFNPTFKIMCHKVLSHVAITRTSQLLVAREREQYELNQAAL